ncbi:MAG: TIGR02281 family clan AA aspartic protease [Novosphingobium sp.]|nr:TIGR02281 family clan AA aspartic protease [Novosphingobium sp.]
MNRIHAFALFAITAGAISAIAAPNAPADREQGTHASPRETSPRKSGMRQAWAASDGQTVIPRDGAGRFYLDADVNGQSTRFLVDTGADMVALTVNDAAQLGIEVDPASFQPITRTASGIGYGAPVTIDRLDVAGREMHDVRAVVVDGLDTNLMGQSVLRQLGRIELHDSHMVIG